MAANDTIADMLTRIRNATMAKQQATEIPATKMTHNIARVLKQEGILRILKKWGKASIGI